MSDLSYIESGIKNYLVNADDEELLSDIQNLKKEIEALVVSIRKEIGGASFIELCKNVAYYLHLCLNSANIINDKPDWVCSLNVDATHHIESIINLVKNPDLWTIAYEIHTAYLGHISLVSMKLMQFSSQQAPANIKDEEFSTKKSVAKKEAANYTSIVKKFKLSKPPLF